MKTDQKKSFKAKEIYARLIPFIKPYRARLVLGVVCGMLNGGASFGLIIALKWALGGIGGKMLNFSGGMPSMGEVEGDAGSIPLSRLLLTVAILPTITIVQGLVTFAATYFVSWVGGRVIMDLRAQMFEHIHALPMQFFSESRSGDLISRLTADTGVLTTLVSTVVGDIIKEPFALIGFVGAMFFLDWKLSLIALVIFPICILPVTLLARRIRKASKSGLQSIADILSVVQESIAGAMVVKAFQTEAEEVGRFNAFNRKLFNMGMRQTRAGALNEPFMSFVSALGIVAVVLYSYMHQVPFELLFAFGAAMVSMYKPAKKLSRIHMHIQGAAPGAERVFEILDITNTIDDKPDAISFAGSVNEIKFRNVGFAYDEKRVLDGVNLDANSGQCIAFVGSSGAGKTTLVNLIPRFFDVSEGAITLNGKDIRDYTVQSLRSQIGVVTQDTVLFNRSVADNISYGAPHATREMIEDAAKRANAHKFILELENGYDTVIGERGSLLSGGMAQRVAIARALFKNPPILILDEATSALDTESERLVQGALDELMKDRTVFVIAHRLSTIAHADAIMVLDQGEIVERGSHDELLAHGGKYKYLYDIQFSNSSS